MTTPSSDEPLNEQGDTECPLVLIVDDNELNLKLARDVLRAAGLRTLEATNGVDGIALAAEQLPSVILMDIRLPDMGGTDAAQWLRDDPRTASIPVVALSALPLERGDDWAPSCGLRGLSREADQRRRVRRPGAPLLHTHRPVTVPGTSSTVFGREGVRP